MKVAFLNQLDPYDRHSWSGIIFYMLQSLERHLDIKALGPTGRALVFGTKAICRFSRVCLRKNINSTHIVVVSKAMGRIFARRLSAHNFDLIFAPSASLEIAFLETALPIVYFADLTFKLLRNYAPQTSRLIPWSLRQSETVEQRALHRADHLVFCSQWARESAIRDYAIPEHKTSVIPMGANLDKASTTQDIMVRRRLPKNDCRLLFVGVDWERKGGDIALSATTLLRDRGINASLTIVGTKPPNLHSEHYIQVIPFLDKALPQHRRQLDSLLLESDFMLFPTRREAFGIVCCEANAFGLPLIASDVGGVPVINGDNGILLPPHASGSDYADAIQALLDNPTQYVQLAQAGRRAFESRLNWDAWAASMSEVFHRVLADRGL